MEVHAHDGGAPLRASYSTTLINGVRAADRAASQIMMANRPASAKKQKQREAARLLSMGLSAAAADPSMVGASSVRRIRSRAPSAEPAARRAMPGHGVAERKARNALFALETGASRGASVHAGGGYVR